MPRDRVGIVKDILLGLAVLIVGGLLLHGILNILIIQQVVIAVITTLIITLTSFVVGGVVRSMWGDFIKYYVYSIFRRNQDE